MQEIMEKTGADSSKAKLEILGKVPQRLIESLAGPKIMDLERVANRDISDIDFEKAKERYGAFISLAVDILKKEFGFKNLAEGSMPTKEEAVALVTKITEILWSNFYPYETVLLMSLFAPLKESEHEEGQVVPLDCDTSAMVCAEVLSQFGYQTALAGVPGHVALKVRIRESQELYFETLTNTERDPGLEFFQSKDELLKKYKLIRFEEPFDTDMGLIHRHIAEILSSRKEYKQSMEEYDKALQKTPGDYAIYFNLGNLYAGMGDFGAAEEMFTSARDLLELSMVHPDETISEAEAFTKAGGHSTSTSAAMRDLGNILYLRAYARQQLGISNPDKNRQALEDVELCSRLLGSPVRIISAKIHFSEGEYDKALGEIKKIFQKNMFGYYPQVGETHVAFLRTLEQRFESMKSPSFLQELAEAYLYLGIGIMASSMYVGKDPRFEEMVECFGKCLSIQPENMEARLLRSKAYFDVGGFSEAIPDCEEILKLEPKNGEVLVRLGRAYRYMQHSDLEKASEFLIKALEIDKAGSAAYVFSSLAAMELSDMLEDQTEIGEETKARIQKALEEYKKK